MSIERTAFVLGTIPVTQQIVGVGAILAGLVVLVGSVAKRIFHGIQNKVFERQLESEMNKNVRNEEKIASLEQKLVLLQGRDLANGKREEGKIEQASQGIGLGVLCLIYGTITAIPVAGTVLNAFVLIKRR